MGKITIKKSELDKIIKEEALKFRKALSLKKELGNVEKELKQLNEVEAGAEIESPGKPFQGKQHKANFHNPAKNPHTMMEDEAENIEDTEIDTEVDVDSSSDTIDKAAVLSAIEDLKMALNLHGVSDVESSEEESIENNGEEIGDDDQEFEFDSEEGENEEGEEEAEGEEEIEEGGYNETHQDEKGNVVNADDVQENVEESMEEKTEEVAQPKSSEDTLMESEKRRMAVLAGIVKG